MSQLLEIWPVLVGVIGVIISLITSAHVVLYKRDTRSAIAWVGLVWLAPILGSILYLWLGVNRIHRRARKLRVDRIHRAKASVVSTFSEQRLVNRFGGEIDYLQPLVHLVGNVTNLPLLSGNRVTPLLQGDASFPAMIRAIDQAAESITLSTYIFDHDRAGNLFLEALSRAVSRQVSVRVLIDDVGASYSWPSMVSELQRAGIRVARFLPTAIPFGLQHFNLRLHRKVLVVDGLTGFTGGMNIREGCCLDLKPRFPFRDLHFQITGPVVSQLQEVFVDDWEFCTGERLDGEPWFAAPDPQGQVLARAIPHGPDDNYDDLRFTLLGALAAARKSVQVVSPYFLPDAALITALNVAALRGLKVDIVLPQSNNLAVVQWASAGLLWQVLQFGCRVWMSPPPFDHSKLMLIDDVWTLLGSANWDPRSLRLNFELNLECYDRELALQLRALVQQTISQSEPVTLDDINARSLPIKLRDGLARLFSPYL